MHTTQRRLLLYPKRRRLSNLVPSVLSPSSLVLLFLSGLVIFERNHHVVRREQSTRQPPLSSATLEALNSFSLKRRNHSDAPLTNKETHVRVSSLDTTIAQDVTFVPPQSLLQLDAFSATWWQSKQRFLKHIALDHSSFWYNQLVEGAVFQFISTPKRPKKWKELRMTIDWLQFAVEHTSKAWKQSGWRKTSETIPYNAYVDKLLAYTNRTLSATKNAGTTTATGMSETIALVAFMPYGNSFNITRGQVMTVANLVATLASLVRVECGRILLVVEQTDWSQSLASTVAAAKLLLQQSIPMERDLLYTKLGSRDLVDEPKIGESFEFKVQKTEIALVTINCTLEEGSVYQKKNKKAQITKLVRLLPKASLLGLHRAFSNQGNVTELDFAHQWLGSNLSRWDYVYLTEPDTLLHTKLGALHKIRNELDQGAISVPWRLQPIPHESDLSGFTNDQRHVMLAEGSLEKVQSFKSGDKCCDRASHPGLKFPKCKTFWFLCGFSEKRRGSHFRVEPYGLVRLEKGTGITSIAGGCNGRQCVPKRADESCEDAVPLLKRFRLHQFPSRKDKPKPMLNKSRTGHTLFGRGSVSR